MKEARNNRRITLRYRHDAAMFLKARGWIDHDGVLGGAVVRPDSDREILVDLARRIEGWVS